MRTFVAVDIPQEVKDKIRSAQKEIVGVEKGLTATKEFHITLKFLGEISEDELKAINEKFEQIKYHKFTARLGPAGVFPDEKSVRVAWIGVESGGIDELHKLIDEALSYKFPKDHKFTTHITLARIRFLEDKAGFLERVRNIKLSDQFPVDEFRLKKSTLTPSGPLHEDLAVYALM